MQRAVKYAIETLNIERCLVIKKDRDERKLEAITGEGIETDIENKANELALLVIEECVLTDSPALIENIIKAKLFKYLGDIKYYNSRYKNRLELELDADRRLESCKKRRNENDNKD